MFVIYLKAISRPKCVIYEKNEMYDWTLPVHSCPAHHGLHEKLLE